MKGVLLTANNTAIKARILIRKLGQT